MLKIRNPAQKTLLILLLCYAAASLVHFIHNAEFLADYPNLPDSWTRAGVYRGWIGLTTIGIFGWIVLNRGNYIIGLTVLAVYAVLGLDSLGHYVAAPLPEHTLTMNVTILLEVGAAAFVLIEVVRQLAQRIIKN
jgi:hypothetical protein